MKWAALLGNPLGHTLSPLIHNAAFQQAGIEGTYIPIQVKIGYLEEVVTGLCFMENLLGFNVTVPFKEATKRLMDFSSQEVELIGAVNTVKRGEDKLIGYNTDWSGFLKALEEAWGANLEGKKVLILGGGGAARAAIYALHTRKAGEILVAMRSHAKSEKLIETLSWTSINVITFEKGTIEKALPETDLLVNATPLGLKGEAMPFSLAPMKEKGFVMDLIYNPPITPLLQEAKERGLRCSNGLSMLLYQALEAFYIWTGHSPDPHPIKNLLKNWENTTAA
ncbi:MAG: shikimate dehydrogenase [Aquificota bacterium]|nr:MAG: shikimate dehydrogenase [Aquificota bacterium]